MEQRERRPHVSTETVDAWEQQVWDTSPPWVPPYNMEKQLLDETGRVFNPIFHDDKDALNSVAWTWPTACAWIAWQTFDGAASGVAAFRHWRGMIWREKEWSFDVRPGRLMPVPKADRLLVNALTTGKLSAEAVRGGDVVTIGAGEWPRLAWEKAAHGEVIEFDRLLMLGAPRYEGVTLPRAAVMRLWPALDGWAPDGAEGPVEEPPAAAEAPIDVDFTSLQKEALVLTGAVTVNEPVTSEEPQPTAIRPTLQPSRLFAGRPSLAHFYEPEYRRRTQSGESVGSEREATILREWLSSEVDKGKVDLGGYALPSVSAIKKNVLEWRREEKGRTKIRSG